MEAVDTTKNHSLGFVIPKRFIMAGLTFLILLLSFMSRNILPIAASLLIEQNAKQKTSNWTSICGSSQNASKKHEPYKDLRKVIYDWSPNAVGSLEMYFSIGCGVGNLLGGYFADAYGAKPVISIGILGESVITLITPFLVYITNRNITAVFTVRAIHGIFLGLLIASVSTLMPHWIPPKERARVCALAYLGIMVGSPLEAVATPSMIKTHHDWAVPFYVYGCTEMVLLFIWWLYGSSDPDSSPIIDSAEILYIEKAFKGTVDHRRKKIPFRRILLSRPVWAAITGTCSHLWGWYFNFVFVTNYKIHVLGINTPTLFSKVLPWMCMMLSNVVSGFVTELVINKKFMDRTAIRKTVINMGNTGAPMYMLAGSYASCNLQLANTLFSMAMASMGIVVVGMKLVIMDMTPNYTGFITGLSFCASLALRALIQYFVAVLVPDKTVLQFRNMFWISLGFCFAMNFVFTIFGETDLQEWNTPFRFN